MAQTTMKVIATTALVVVAAFGGALLAGALGDDREVVSFDSRGAAVPAIDATDDNRGLVKPAIVDDADDVPVTGGELRRVQEAALRAAGGGMITEVDRSDDPGEAYEVEVVRNGFDTDVALDGALRRVRNASYDD